MTLFSVSVFTLPEVILIVLLTVYAVIVRLIDIEGFLLEKVPELLKRKTVARIQPVDHYS